MAGSNNQYALRHFCALEAQSLAAYYLRGAKPAAFAAAAAAASKDHANAGSAAEKSTTKSREHKSPERSVLHSVSTSTERSVVDSSHLESSAHHGYGSNGSSRHTRTHSRGISTRLLDDRVPAGAHVQLPRFFADFAAAMDELERALLEDEKKRHASAVDAKSPANGDQQLVLEPPEVKRAH